MSFSHRITVAVLAFLPLAATAQQLQQASPADANAPVPVTGYVSAFKNYIPTPAETASPDQVWRAANEEVGRSDPHASHGAMAGMTTPPAAQQAGAAQADLHAGHGAMPGMKAAPAAPKPSSTQPDPHAGHGMPMTAPVPAKADPHAGHSGHNH